MSNYFKVRLQRLNQKVSQLGRYINPVGFFNSYQQNEMKQFALQNPNAVIFYGEDELKD